VTDQAEEPAQTEDAEDAKILSLAGKAVTEDKATEPNRENLLNSFSK